MKLLKVSLAVLFALSATFLGAAFVSWEIDPAMWGMFVRGNAIFLGVIFAGIAGAMAAGIS